MAKLPVYLIKDHFLKMFGRVKLCLQAFLTSAVDGDEWSVSDLGLLSPEKRFMPVGSGVAWPQSLSWPCIEWKVCCCQVSDLDSPVVCP